jgi:hypothetical protein
VSYLQRGSKKSTVRRRRRRRIQEKKVLRMHVGRDEQHEQEHCREEGGGVEIRRR